MIKQENAQKLMTRYLVGIYLFIHIYALLCSIITTTLFCHPSHYCYG